MTGAVARAVVGIVASLIVPVAVAARALEPAGPSGCTISGTNGNDVLREPRAGT